MQDICFGIASYRRADNQRTLDYLERMGIDREHIIMSVQCEEDRAQYERAGIGNTGLERMSAITGTRCSTAYRRERSLLCLTTTSTPYADSTGKGCGR